MKKKGVYFQNLDTIRFIAAMMVLLGHAMSESFRHLGVEGTLVGRLLDVISDGGMGVSIFFVLSGFLITYLILLEIETKGKLDVKRFYIRRCLRIWPLYYAVVFFSFIVYPGLKELIGVNSPLGSNFVYHLFFLSNFDVINIAQNCYGSDAMSQNITWSVSIEEQFYLFWPLLFLLPRKLWGVIIAGLACFSIGFRIKSVEEEFVNYFHTFAVLIDLILGAAAALAIKRVEKIRKVFENTNTISHSVLFLLVISILCLDRTTFIGEYSESWGRVVTSILFALIIASQAITKNHSILNLGNFKFATKWGKLTYGIYLLHPIVITLVDVFLRALKIEYKTTFVPEFLVAILIIILTFAISKLSYYKFESYFLNLKKKFQLVPSNSGQ